MTRWRSKGRWPTGWSPSPAVTDRLALLVVAPRLPLGLLQATTDRGSTPRLFDDARLVLPPTLGVAEADDLIGGGDVAIVDGQLSPAGPLGRFPVAVLALREPGS